MRSVLLSVFVLCLILCGSLRGQDDSERVFGQIHQYLKGDIRARGSTGPLLFVGEIVAMGPVFPGVCKQPVSQSVDFNVTELLLGDLSDNEFHNAYPNCTRQPLPSPPFSLLAQVILYCHHHHFCFQPVPATPERVKTVRAWIAEARRPEDDAAFAELRRAIKKANPLAPNRDLIFEGEIASIEPIIERPACLIAVRRKVAINVVKVLFGQAPARPIETGYGSTNCPIPTPLSVRLHAKVIVYCMTQMNMPQVCLTPVEDSPRRLSYVSGWIAVQNQSDRDQSGRVPTDAHP